MWIYVFAHRLPNAMNFSSSLENASVKRLTHIVESILQVQTVSHICYWFRFYQSDILDLRLEFSILGSLVWALFTRKRKNLTKVRRMPFMKGRAPIRRTLNYLNYGKLMLKNQIKVFSINYHLHGDHHAGARDFAFWYFPQIQYKNPGVQVITLKNLTPSPFIRCFYGKSFLITTTIPLHSSPSIILPENRYFCLIENGKELIIDIDGKSKEDILAHCIKVLGKSA